MITRLGKSVRFDTGVYIKSFAAVVGKKESDGPLGAYFNLVETDEYSGLKSFEAAESAILKRAVSAAFSKIDKVPSDADVIFSGDLLNQCTSSTYALCGFGAPHLGIYGACSTMSEGLLLSALSVASGFSSLSANATSSHFCTAERQFRFPLEYGSQRPPTSQWTATASGCVVLSPDSDRLKITEATVGKIVDKGICDANNMGAAMAPAFADTVYTHLSSLSARPEDYDLFVSGDLGVLGTSLADELLKRNFLNIEKKHFDCGKELYHLKEQDVHCGGSGCGCSAAVLSGYILPEMLKGKWHRILFAATGSLMSAERSKQGETIPGICHAVTIERA